MRAPGPKHFRKRDRTVTAELERLEPGVEHINAGIPGTAPDAYLAVLQRWLASIKQRFKHPMELT